MASECSAACMGSAAPKGRCKCRCGGKSHGASAQTVPAASPDGTVLAAAPPRRRGAFSGVSYHYTTREKADALIEHGPAEERLGTGLHGLAFYTSRYPQGGEETPYGAVQVKARIRLEKPLVMDTREKCRIDREITRECQQLGLGEKGVEWDRHYTRRLREQGYDGVIIPFEHTESGGDYLIVHDTSKIEILGVGEDPVRSTPPT